MKSEKVILEDEDYKCPGCKDTTSLMGGEQYCPECGQKLDWAETQW